MRTVKVQAKPVGTEADASVPIYEWTVQVGGSGQTVQLSGLHEGVYTVRAMETSGTRWLRAELKGFAVPQGGGNPNPMIPAPSWAEAVIPVDSVPSGGFGPSSASGVNLASGEYENTPPEDIYVNNPRGPDVAFKRRYSSYLAKQGYASPGMSLGWVHQYDIRMEGVLGSWEALSLVYPNGARETLTPEIVGGMPTGRMFPPNGAPYCASGTPSTPVGRWDPIVIVHRDMSKWIFRPHSIVGDNRQVYRLANIVDRAGNYVTLIWDASGRLDSITRSDGRLLIKCQYSGANLQTVEAYGTNNTVYARVRFEYQNGLLTGVSQIANGASAPLRWGYRYRTIGSTPLIVSVGTQDPSASVFTDQLVWHSIGYDGQGTVAMMVDANGHARTYTYNGSTTNVKVYNQSTGQVDFQWTQRIGAKNVNAGIQDAEQNSSAIGYQHDYLPTTYTNRNGQTNQLVYDVYGNVVEVISPRGIRLVYTYDYPPDYPCSPIRQVTVTEFGNDNSYKLSTRYVFYQQTGPVPDVVGGYAIAGFLAQVIEPKPGISGGDPNDPNNFVVTKYYYTQIGSLLEVRSPAPNNTPGAFRTIRYFYGTDPYVGYTDPEGERIDMPIAVGVYEGTYDPNQPFARLLYRESWRYDEKGNVVKVIRGRRGDTAVAYQFETQIEYNLAGQVVQVTYPPRQR